MFRIPTETEQRQQWIHAISAHQNFDQNRSIVYVCIRHFDPSSIVIRGNQKILKIDAVPTIFNVVVKISHANNLNSNQNESTNVTALQAKIQELEKEIVKLNIQHSIELQKIEINAKKKIQKKNVELKVTKTELSKQKNKLLRLEDVIQDLRENQYISPDDAKFLNLKCYFPIFLFQTSCLLQ